MILVRQLDVAGRGSRGVVTSLTTDGYRFLHQSRIMINVARTTVHDSARVLGQSGFFPENSRLAPCTLLEGNMVVNR